jgi:hypothetical protein
MLFSTLTRRLLVLSLLSISLCSPGAFAADAPDKASAVQVKAAFLHKFAGFVDWPQGSFPRADSPLKIGVIGDQQLWQELSELARERPSDGRPVTVTRIAPGDPVAGFHILYLRAASLPKMADLLSEVPAGVLTVADLGGAHPRGSVMSFFQEDGRVRFGVSLEAAARQHLRLSSRLLAVARNVQGLFESGQLMARVARALSLG